MHSKKLLSVCLALVLACACLFGLCTLNAGAAATTWKVDGTQYATLQAAIDDAATKTWAAGDELVIEITATDAQTVKAVDGILFGAKTIFRADNTRLPITIKGGTLACDASITGEIACANSYNFSNLAFDIGDKEVFFFAGSGEVRLTVVNLGTSPKCHFYGDAPSGKCFENWTAANADAAKVDGLVKTSMTFDGTSYNSKYAGVSCAHTQQNFSQFSSYVAAVGGISDVTSTAVKSTDLMAELAIVGGSVLNDISVRDPLAHSSVKALVVTLQGNDTTVENFYGMGGAKLADLVAADGSTKASGLREAHCIAYPDCDVYINGDGGIISGHAFFSLVAKYTGSLNINLKGTVIGSQSNACQLTDLTGDVNIVFDGVDFKATY